MFKRMYAILSADIKNGDEIDKQIEISLILVILCMVVILLVALLWHYVSNQRVAAEIREQRQSAIATLARANAPSGEYERVPQGWKHTASGRIIKEKR
jgi:hypothetical protein